MVSPKWQEMWIESQHCSKGIVNVPLASQQAKRVLDDLKTSCCSPNKAVQVEALKCWGLWIHNQNPDAWKANTVCFTAIRPLISKKLQPLHKDVDICKLKLSLMWALLVKVQDIMQLEGPQYILEVFLQSCLTWLSSSSGDDSEKDIFLLIFQLLLVVFNKNETLPGCDREEFPPLSSDILHIKKVFHQLVDKFLSIFAYWRRVEDKSVVLKLWRHFLEYCEESCEHIPVPVWRNIFKLAGQICSEKDEPVKEKLAFLHSCATTLKSALSSPKFIDFGNLLTTPCEALLKKLVELCTVECHESRDSEMFLHSKEICQVLSEKSVAINGYDLCISVLDVLEEFCHKSLFWGVWCGLVYCFKVLLMGTHPSQFSKTETKFYRKLRGVVVNLELDRKDLHEDCVKEVERHIALLNISCVCSFRPVKSGVFESQSLQSAESAELKETILSARCDFNGASNKIVPVAPRIRLGRFSLVSLQRRKFAPNRKPLNINFDIIEDILSTLSVNSTKTLLGSMLTFGLISARTAHRLEMIPRTWSAAVDVGVGSGKEAVAVVSCREEKGPSTKRPLTPSKRNVRAPTVAEDEPESEEEIISTPTTRSKRRAEEEKRKTELEAYKKRRRKSFEVIVQEIVRKNKERKTEKNKKKRKSPDGWKGRGGRRKAERQSGKGREESNVCDRRLRNSKRKEQSMKQNRKAPSKKEGKLENYFKVIRKKSGIEAKKAVQKPSKAKKDKKRARQSTCCESEVEEGERRGETGWRQTSLKSMMNPKSKAEKVRQGTRSKNKTTNVTEKPKVNNDARKTLTRPFVQLSPYKEVLHDHEYAKMTSPDGLDNLGRTKPAPEKKKKNAKSQPRKHFAKPDVKKTPESDPLLRQTKASAHESALKMEKLEERDERPGVVAPALVVQIAKVPKSKEAEVRQAEVSKLDTPAETNFQNSDLIEATMCSKMDQMEPASGKESVSEEKSKTTSLKNFQVLSGGVYSYSDENREELSENELTHDKRGKKRARTPEAARPWKKLRLKEEEVAGELSEEKLPLEVTEKENLEETRPELTSPVKKEKGGSSMPMQSGSPRAVSGGMSRALRIIGLVPESTKGRSWEASPRMEASKCPKAPNVDKNSRASKMLALLSENVVEPEEMVFASQEEVNRSSSSSSSTGVATTPDAKTPLSSLKSPKSVKKRRSIRFDDAKNETVLYQTDTPPSQILEEKEKCRGMRPFEIALYLP